MAVFAIADGAARATAPQPDIEIEIDVSDGWGARRARESFLRAERIDFKRYDIGNNQSARRRDRTLGGTRNPVDPHRR